MPGWTNSAGVMILNPGKFLASAVGSLTQPLFNRGQVVAQYRIARAQQEEAALGFQQTLLNAGSEVNDALTAYQTSQGKKLLLDKQVASLQTALRSTSLLMEHGNTTYLEVLTARQTLLSAQLSQTANHFTEIQSLIKPIPSVGRRTELKLYHTLFLLLYFYERRAARKVFRGSSFQYSSLYLLGEQPNCFLNEAVK